MNPKLRLEVYREMLPYYSKRCWGGMCAVLTKVSKKMGVSKEIREYSELMSQKPDIGFGGGWWWKPEDEQPRIKAINNAIEQAKIATH